MLDEQNSHQTQVPRVFGVVFRAAVAAQHRLAKNLFELLYFQAETQLGLEALHIHLSLLVDYCLVLGKI